MLLGSRQHRDAVWYWAAPDRQHQAYVWDADAAGMAAPSGCMWVGY